MRPTNAQLLLLVNFLYFLAAGIVVPVFSKQILRNGGNYIVIGSVQSVVFVAQFISKDVIGLIEREKLYIIRMFTYCCFICFTLLLLVVSWWAVSFIRISYAFTTQILPYSKILVAKCEPRSRKIKIRNLLDVMRVSGLSVGSIAGGFIFEATKDFSSIATTSSVISLLTMIIVYQIDYNENEIERSESQIFSYGTTCNAQLLNLRETSITDEWYDVAVKLTYTCAFVNYFARFSFILCYNYPVNSIIIGWTRAYYNIVLFLSNFLVPFIKDRTHNPLDLLEKTLIICAFCLVGHSYAPTYKCYMVLYIPLLFTYTLSNALLEDDALDLKYNFPVYLACETMGNIIKIFAPFCIGVTRQWSGSGVTKLLTVIPAVIYTCMLTFRFLNKKERRQKYSVESEHEIRIVRSDESDSNFEIENSSSFEEEEQGPSTESNQNKLRKVTLVTGT
ncbi:hypothetical protein Zmor_028005 [Zophobas morio]|uniref:Uncharacterized protein n=1 Tax=Zophobas morio TaxID=2755281 RepID=A0AA38M3I8_9CUCU|nr:hypothetical protein Zmor_028005 [Zophobas morio]